MKLIPVSAAAAVVLAGCGTIDSISSDVSSFGDWPAERRPGTYAFDRLPSQQAQAAETEKLEAAARPALEKAGFQPAAEGADPDVLVQVGARSVRSQRVVWDDPFWYHGLYGSPWRHGLWGGPGWYGAGWYGWYRYDVRYDREVALLVRDRASGKPLFESRAANESTWAADPVLLTAMFQAALADFPRTGVNPRRVVVALPPRS